MTRELQALENIGTWGYQDYEGDLILCSINNKEDFIIVENALKALEVISENFRLIDNRLHAKTKNGWRFIKEVEDEEELKAWKEILWVKN